MILSIDVGTVNLAMCLIGSQDHIIHEWDVDGIPTEHADGLFPTLKKHLDARPWVLSSNVVLIERQPDKNKRMKSVENFLHTYFLVHERNTILYDAKHKVPDVSGPGKVRYRQRKAASIERCQEFLKQSGQTERLAFFKTHRKKDDLADTVMQALSYTAPTNIQKRPTVRKPTANQTETRYSKQNLAWLVKNNLHTTTARFTKDLKRYYVSLDELVQEFFPSKS
jgi:Poxvirus A22 protein